MPDTEFHDARLSERPTGRDPLRFVAVLLLGISICARGATPDVSSFSATQDLAVRGDLVVRTPNEKAKVRNSSVPGNPATAGTNGFAQARDLLVRSKAMMLAQVPDGGVSAAPATTQHLTLDTFPRPSGLQNLWANPSIRPVNLRSYGAVANPAMARNLAAPAPASASAIASATGSGSTSTSASISTGTSNAGKVTTTTTPSTSTDVNAADERARLRKLAASATQGRSTQTEVANNTSDDSLPRELACEARSGNGVIELEDAILSAICANPQARGAWANARAAAAALNVARAAYLPAVNVTGNISRNTLSSTYDFSAIGLGSVSQAQHSLDRQAALELNWVLYDFGKRSAGKRRASALLDAAGAEYDETLQRVFFNAAQAYYAVQDAQASADAARQAESVAAAGLAVARARHAGGAGGMSDLLQASTAYRRAQVDRVNADGAVSSAYGALAVAMGLDANTPLTVAPSAAPESVTQVSQSVDRLIETAKAHRPSLEAARARLAAAQADVDAARAQYWPTISLVGRLDKSSNPVTQQAFGSAPISGTHSSMVGVQVNIPLTDGIANRYRTAQARAARDAEEASVQDAELQASLDVWQAYQELQTDAKNLDNTQSLLSEAARSLDLARGRYKEGIGTLMELLSAQTSQADAQKQRIQAISRWRLGRLRLAQSLGTLGLWDLTQ